MTDNMAEDWIALWQSELTAMAADRELRESITAMLALWASTADVGLSLLNLPHDAGRNAQAVQPPRPTPAAAPPECGLDEDAKLNHQSIKLEQRLAGLE